MRHPLSSRAAAVALRSLVGVVLPALVVIAFAALISRRPSEPTGIVKPLPELSMADLVLEDGRLRQPGNPAPFTGQVVEGYPDGALRSRSAVSNGLLHGLSQGWYTNGQLQISEHFRNGVSHGVRTKWYPHGLKLSEASIENGQLHGVFRRWHENGVLSEDVNFSHGEPEGISLAYFQSGFLKTRVRMQAGNVLERKSWTDGEFKP
jgi:antitoxin component YwqK of YwqJK toxin-antitoxin module